MAEVLNKVSAEPTMLYIFLALKVIVNWKSVDDHVSLVGTV